MLKGCRVFAVATQLRDQAASRKATWLEETNDENLRGYSPTVITTEALS